MVSPDSDRRRLADAILAMDGSTSSLADALCVLRDSRARRKGRPRALPRYRVSAGAGARRIRVRIVVDRVYQIADFTFNVDPSTTFVVVKDCGGPRGTPEPPHVVVTTGHGLIEATVSFLDGAQA